METKVTNNRILVVEDEPGVRALINRILSREGYDVVMAASGSEALETLAELDDVDLVVSDIVMPGMKGTEMVRTMHENHPELPILYVTGYPQEDNLTLGPNERLLLKPFNQRDLLSNVSDALSKTV
ncbi:MAG: response regulator [Gammaproteobacteria bacterium]|nr:response regulator [Gammaproteobacteria bacterium]